MSMEMGMFWVFYSKIPTFLHDIVLGLCITSVIGSISYLFYLLIAPYLRKNLYLEARQEKSSLLFVLLLFVLPFQFFFVQPPSILNFFYYITQFSAELQGKVVAKMIDQMILEANRQYIPSDLGIPYFYHAMVLFSYLWMVVFIIKSLKTWLTYFHFHGKVKRQLVLVTQEENPEVFRQFQSICEEISIKTDKVKLYTHPNFTTPMLMGVLEPKVVLPLNFLTENENKTPEAREELLRTVFIHELTHYKNKDLWVKFLGQVTMDLQWFNPVLRNLLSRIDFYCELVCDQVVVTGLEQEKRENYAQNILNVVRNVDIPLVSMAKFGDFEWKSTSVKTRLERILDENPKGNKWISICYLLGFVLFLLFFCFKFSEIAPRIDSFFPYITSIYPEFRVCMPSWFPF